VVTEKEKSSPEEKKEKKRKGQKKGFLSGPCRGTSKKGERKKLREVGGVERGGSKVWKGRMNVAPRKRDQGELRSKATGA